MKVWQPPGEIGNGTIPRTEKKHPEDSPAPSPHRACRDEEGEPTGTEKVAGVRRKIATPGPPVHE